LCVNFEYVKHTVNCSNYCMIYVFTPPNTYFVQ